MKLRRGDTLIEATIALGILTLLLATATTSAIRSYRTADASRERTIAYNLVQSQADALRAYRASMAWEDFTSCGGSEPDRITNKIYLWFYAGTCISSTYAYPSPGNVFSGRNPNFKMDPDDPTVDGGPILVGRDGTGGMTNSATNSGSGVFYMCNKQDTSLGCTVSPPAGLSDGWYTSSRRVKKVTVTNNDYYVYIVGQRANVDVNNTCVGNLTNNVIRFDIRTKWKSRLSQTYQTSSLVMYLANTNSSARPSGVCP